MADFYDTLINNILNKVNSKMVELSEDAVPQQQPVQQPQAQPAPQQTVPVQQPAQPMPQQPQAGEEQPVENEETGEKEIQEMAGQLAQLLRDYKKENPGQDIEVSKFAAGMVVAAAIKDMEIEDRKDIIKKLKAGDYDDVDGEEGEEEMPEEQPVEEPQPQQQPVQETYYKFSKGQLTEIFAKLKEEQNNVTKTIKTKSGNEQNDLNTAAQDVNSTNVPVTIVNDETNDETNITPTVTADKANSSEAATALKKYGSINVAPNNENA